MQSSLLYVSNNVLDGKLHYNDEATKMIPYSTTPNGKQTSSLVCLIAFYWLSATVVRNRINQSQSCMKATSPNSEVTHTEATDGSNGFGFLIASI